MFRIQWEAGQEFVVILAKLDTDAIGERVQLLMKLLERPRSTLEAIRDAVLPIEDG